VLGAVLRVVARISAARELPSRRDLAVGHALGGQQQPIGPLGDHGRHLGRIRPVTQPGQEIRADGKAAADDGVRLLQPPPATVKSP
jgi:hypothetical protein